MLSPMVHQAQNPHGMMGRLFAPVMERLNQPAYRAAQSALSLPRGGHVLEIGFGTGALLSDLVRADPSISICGIEVSHLMLNQAQKRLAPHGQTDLRLGDVAALPWGDNLFDGVTALHCFQFWPTPERAIREIARTLKPGGRLVLVLRDHGTRPPHWLPNPMSRSADETAALITLLTQNGMRVERQENIGPSPLIVAAKTA